MRAVFCRWLCILPLGACFLTTGTVTAFESATVTRLENRVSVGQAKDGRPAARRPAAVSDVVKASDYLLTETESRAELQFDDKSIVRVGQNTVFSFDSSSRTLSLQKGAMLFYVPPGTGGTIKTPSLTAAITGTIGKCTPNLIAVISGSLMTPLGVIPAGWAIQWSGGQLRKFPYPISQATTGILYAWGPFPELPGVLAITDPREGTPDDRWWFISEVAVLNPQVNAEKPPMDRTKRVRPPRDDDDSDSDNTSY